VLDLAPRRPRRRDLGRRGDHRRKLADLVLDLGHRGKRRCQLADPVLGLAAGITGASSPTWCSTGRRRPGARLAAADLVLDWPPQRRNDHRRQLADLALDLGRRGPPLRAPVRLADPVLDLGHRRPGA
jgi:hypothetical protein